jgi:hypothetical protein
MLACESNLPQRSSKLLENNLVMRFRIILSFMTMALACFTVAVWSAPVGAEPRQPLVPDETDHRQFE